MGLLRRRIPGADWRPVGVKELEDNALLVVRSTANRSVIAGPGAGKTELLAQRAAYLLQTGMSPAPQRILAISFKRDAATNLAARVRVRCHEEQAQRIDSLTFDAFAKGLLDRFGQGLPDEWRPTADYEIQFPNETTYRGFLSGLGNPPAEIGSRADIEAITAKSFERLHLFGSPLATSPKHPSPAQWAASEFWRSALRGGSRSYLSFPMIGRLSELLLRYNPMVREALALTYSHLFMDEFQDTTQIQYDLVKTIFLGSSAVVTAVGDNKQQIMRWAMAMEDPFTAFEQDFKARRIPLLNNYRSSPELVRIQHILAQALDTRSVKPVSKTEGTISGESCAVWDYSSPQQEAKGLADFINAQMAEHDLGPRDFVVVVRQKASDYANSLAPTFAAKGIALRNEAAALVPGLQLQELLTEELSEIVVKFARFATSERAGGYWNECQDLLTAYRGLSFDDEVGRVRLGRELEAFGEEFRKKYLSPPTDKATAGKVVTDIGNFVGRDNIVAACPAYRQGDWLKKVAGATAHHLEASCKGAVQWSEALDNYEGRNALPLMTIHKSKGLEYHTVVFVGLDDGAWWSFANDALEGTAGFFVAFSRAKQRVIFTYCPTRGARTKIATLYELLKSAGVSSMTKA